MEDNNLLEKTDLKLTEPPRSEANKFYWTYVRQHATEFTAAMILIYNVCCTPLVPHHVVTNENGTKLELMPMTEGTPILPVVPAFVAGFTIFFLLTMFHYVSLAHISPTVTLGFAMGGNFDWKLVPSYICFQILGSIAGALLAQYTAGMGEVIGHHGIPAGIDSWHIFYLLLAEIQVGFILDLSVNLVVGNPKWEQPTATLFIGLIVFTGVMAGFPAGAGQMNPAKVLATAILSGDFNCHWVWWAASILGSAQSAIVYRLFFAESKLLLLKQLKTE